MELAKTEMTAKVVTAQKNAVTIALGWSIGSTGVLFLLAALVLGLGTLIPLWVSALLVGALVTAAGVLLITRGVRALRASDPLPRETIQTLKEDTRWLKEQSSR
ncbi:phage holin family protein [Sorangium sp. So ce269]